MPLTPVRQVLDNGVVVVAQENHTTAAVSLVVSVRTGSWDDEVGREGTAALVARVLDRGTLTRSAAAIADDLDGRGASMTASAGRHQLGVAAAALADDFAPVLAIVADIVRGPAFPEADVATRRAELLTAIRQEDDDPASVAVHAFMRAAYDGHPYARRVGGTADSVRAVTRADLVSFHARHVTPTATTVVVVGSLPAPVMVEEVVRAFGDWAPAGAGDPGAEVPDPPVRPVRHVERIAMPDKAQAEVAYGFPGLRRLDPQYFAAVIMNNALGQYALGGRLGDSIRERQGMAYYVFSSLDAGIGPGPLLIRAGVAAANVERTIASIDAELAAVCGDGLTAKEVADSIQYMVGALPRQLETNAGIASFLLNAEVYGLGLDYDRRLPALLRAVTHDEAVAVARRLLDPSRATVVVAGPESPSRSAA